MQEDARYDVADDGDKDHTCIPDPSVFTDIASRRHQPKYRRYSFPTTAPSTAPIALPLQQREVPPLQPRAP